MNFDSMTSKATTYNSKAKGYAFVLLSIFAICVGITHFSPSKVMADDSVFSDEEVAQILCYRAIGGELSEEVAASLTPEWRGAKPRENGMMPRYDYDSRNIGSGSSSTSSGSSSFGYEGAGGAWSSDF